MGGPSGPPLASRGFSRSSQGVFHISQAKGPTMETVSTIVTVYNLEACVEETLRSVMAQTYSALEIICVDDGSTDGSPAILGRLAAEDSRIRVITQENAGDRKSVV